MFVYSKLKEIYGERLDFQIEGYGRAEYKTTCDFIIKPSTETSDFYILDAKYKPRYENSQKGIISDIREMSGYAHDEKILAKLQPTSENISCVIVYPSNSYFDDYSKDLQTSEVSEHFDFMNRKVRGFEDFYLYELSLPSKPI